MSAHEEVTELLAQANAMPWGKAEAALVAQAAALAESAGLEDLSLTAYLHLVNSYLEAGQTSQGFSAFAWCADRYRRTPQDFNTERLHALGWGYKRMVGAAIRFPDIALASIEAIYAEAEAFYRSQGEPLRPLLARRYTLAQTMGDSAAAEQAFLGWQASERGEYADCHACDPETEVCYHLDRCDWVQAARAGDAALARDDMSCQSQPELMLSLMLEPYVRLGRFDEAWAAHVRCYRNFQTDSTNLELVYQQVAYLALVGQAGQPHLLERGLRLLTRHLPWWKSAADPEKLMQTSRDAACLLRALVEAGHGDEVVAGTFPGATLPWFADKDLASPTVAEAAEYCQRLALRIARAFDARVPGAGETGPTQRQLAEYWAREPLPRRDSDAIPDVSGVFTNSDAAAPASAGNQDAQAASAGNATDIGTPEPSSREAAPAASDEDQIDEGPELVPVQLSGPHLTTEVRVAVSAAGVAATDPSWTSAGMRAVELFLQPGASLQPPADLSDADATLWLRLASVALVQRGQLPEAIQALEPAVVRAEKLPDPEVSIAAEVAKVQLKVHAAEQLDDLDRGEGREGLIDSVGERINQLPEGLSRPEQLSVLCQGAECLDSIPAAGPARDLAVLVAEQVDGLGEAASAAFPLLYRARLALVAADYYQACMLADQASRTPSEDPLGVRLSALALLAKASKKAGYPDEAIGYAREMLNLAASAQLDCLSGTAAYLLADLLSRAGRHLEVAEVCETALLRIASLSSTDIQFGLRQHLATALAEIGQPSAAADHFLAVGDWLALHDNNTAALKAYTSAADELNNTPRRDEEAEAWGRVAQLTERLRRPGPQQAALRRQARALASGPTPRAGKAGLPQAEALMNQAWQVMHEHPDAFRSLRHEEADWHDDYAFMLWRLDLNGQAFEHSEHAHRLWSDRPELAARPLLLQAMIQVEEDRRSEARETIARIRKLLPRNRGQRILERCDELETQLAERDNPGS